MLNSSIEVTTTPTTTLAPSSVTTDKINTSAVTTAKIAALDITTTLLAASSVTNDKINTSAVTTDKIAIESITTTLLADISVTNDKLAASSVTTDKIAIESITTTLLADISVTNDKLAASSVTTDKINTSAVITAKIANSAVTTAKINTSAVTTAKIKALNVTTTLLAASAVTEAKMKLADNTTFDATTLRHGFVPKASGTGTKYLRDDITWQPAAGGLADSSVTTAKLNTSAVTTAKIKAANITTTLLASSSVTTAKINTSAVTTAKIKALNVTTTLLAASAVTSAKINSSAVTTAKINTSAVTTAKIKAANITTTLLASSSVTTAKINTSAVTTAKIKALNVTTTLLAASAVTSAKINSSAVTTAKINTSAVTTAKIKALNVTTTLLAASAVTSAKINSSAVTTAKINTSAVTTAKIAFGAVTASKLSASASPTFADVTITGLSGNVISSSSVETSIEELDDAIYEMADSGFIEWTSGVDAATYTITGGKFQIDRTGRGKIRGKEITWASGQQTGVLAANAGYVIYIDSTGTLQATTNPATASFSGTIRLFHVLYDGTNYIVIKENHHANWDAGIVLFLHQTINVIIRGIGAIITRVTTGTGADPDDRRIKIVGADTLDDHGNTTAIPATNPVTWQVFIRNPTNWILSSTQSDLPISYNSVGTPTALDAVNAFGIYVLYVAQDDIETSTPQFFAVMGETSYTTLAAAQAAIASGSLIFASNELKTLEPCQLGYAIVQYSVTGGYIEELYVARSTFNQALVGGAASSSHALLTELDYASAGHTGFASTPVTTTQLAASAVTTTEINTSAVTTAKIAATAVTSAKIGTSAITTTKIAASAVTEAKMKLIDNTTFNATTLRHGFVPKASGTGTKFLRDDITWQTAAGELADSSVTTAKLNTSAVTTAKIKALNITTTLLAASAVTTVKLNTSAVTTAKIKALNITTTLLAASTVTTAKINTLAVTNPKLETSSVTATKIASSAVTTPKIKNLNVTTSKIAASAVTTAKINTSAVTTAKIKALNVTTTMLAASAVTTAKIKALNVTTTSIAASAVTEAKMKLIDNTTFNATTLRHGFVPKASGTGTKYLRDDITWQPAAGGLADSSVTTAKLNTSAVTTAKIKALNVTTTLLAASAVTTAKIKALNVTTTLLAASAVTTAKIKALNVTTTSIAASAVTEAKIKLVDNTTFNATTGRHGFVPKASGTTTKFLRDDVTWQTPAGGGITTLKTTADQTINGGAATFVDITGLTFPVVSGTDYAFHFYITFQSAATATGWKAGVNCPAGTLDFWAQSEIIANGAAGVATHTERHNTVRDDMTLLTTTVTQAVDLAIRIEGRYKCTANGTFAARFANELAANTDIVVQKGSWGYWF